ncbi:unnamed protein product [Parascedosporium putredinis]|uniref:Uncharacterized protein n=1 Tax=Parascedosporium putredinis TaxID=1442378 RepID=A0A9P1M7Y7_9PEZI|nr:unnamed protein product [Parascedosporium putredinis]CAI7991520.1 unnamed protein product [Parascedosporium putredinis]
MGRNLPWDRKRNRAPGDNISAPSTPRPAVAVARTPTTEPVQRLTLTDRQTRAGRSPSTSPPPEPPPQICMIEGMDYDDKYRMVEDELLSVARKFTVHLHAAEYHRLKHQAKSRNADAIDSISRPVVGRMSVGVQVKNERLVRARVRQEGLRAALANSKGKGLEVDSEDEAPWTGTSLQGLMEVPQSSQKPLSRLTSSVGPNTKASARPPIIHRTESRSGSPAQIAKHRVEARLARDGVVDPGLPTRRTTMPSARLVQPAKPAKLHSPGHGSQARQSTWPATSGSPAKDPGRKRPLGQRTSLVVLSDSDDDLFASLVKRRKEKEKRRSMHQVEPKPEASDESLATVKQETTSDGTIMPSFLF